LKYLYRILIELTNRRWLSQLLQKFSKSSLSKRFIYSFIRAYTINVHEIEKDVSQYANLHEFFTRKLKNGARQVDMDPLTVVSPVDGVIADLGNIDEADNFVVKGKNYSLYELVGNEEVVEKYRGGSYFVIYLSPRDYHRIHSPIDAKIGRNWGLGSVSYPVNEMGLTYGKSPLTKNRRLITTLEHAKGDVLLIKVGAMFVNSIIPTYQSKQVEKGEEIAYFSFGSTVILLFKKDQIHIASGCKSNKIVTYGEIIARFR